MSKNFPAEGLSTFWTVQSKRKKPIPDFDWNWTIVGKQEFSTIPPEIRQKNTRFASFTADKEPFDSFLHRGDAQKRLGFCSCPDQTSAITIAKLVAKYSPDHFVRVVRLSLVCTVEQQQLIEASTI